MSGIPPGAQAIAKQYPQQPVTFQNTHEASEIRALVVLNNVNFLVPHMEIEQNAHGSTDSTEITIPVKGAPDFTAWLYSNPNASSTPPPIPIQVYIGAFQGAQSATTSTSGLTQIFSGQIDMYDIDLTDPDQATVIFKCRSLGAPLVDNRLTHIPGNMTTTAFVKQIAAQYGLTPNVQLPAGAYPFTVAEVYQHSFAVGLQNQRIWDLLMTMANFDDVDVWVSGSTLNYCAPGQVSRQNLYLTYGRDLSSLKLTHSPRFSKEIRVEVRTYNQKTRQASIQRVQTNSTGGVVVTSSSKTVTATPVFGTQNSQSTSISSTGAQTTTQTTASGGAASSTTGQGNESGPERYIIYKPGISPQAANQLAQATWRRISMQEYSAVMEIPIRRSQLSTLGITMLVRLSGTPFQRFNTTYWPRKLTWTVDIDEGAHLSIEAVNHELPSGAV